MSRMLKILLILAILLLAVLLVPTEYITLAVTAVAAVALLVIRLHFGIKASIVIFGAAAVLCLINFIK